MDEWGDMERMKNPQQRVEQVLEAIDTHDTWGKHKARQPNTKTKPLRFDSKEWSDSLLPFADSQQIRDSNLRLIGFETYADYLQSSVWDCLRSTLIQDDRYQSCLVCGSRSGLQWHHRTYEFPVLVGNFRSADAEPIVRLCTECHCDVAHKDFPPLAESDRRLKVMRMCLINGESYDYAKTEAFRQIKWQ